MAVEINNKVMSFFIEFGSFYVETSSSYDCFRLENQTALLHVTSVFKVISQNKRICKVPLIHSIF